MARPETLQRGVASRMRELTRAAAAIDDPGTANRAIDDGPALISSVIPALRPRGPVTPRSPRTPRSAAPATVQARTEPPPAPTPAPAAPPAQAADEIRPRLPAATVAPARVTNYRATINRALDPYLVVEPRYQRIMNDVLGVFARHLYDYDFDFGPAADSGDESAVRERESGGGEGAGPGGDPDIGNRQAWTRRRAAAGKVLGPLVALLEEEMGGPLYRRIEVANGFSYMITEDALGALGYSDKSIQELDRILRHFEMAPQGEGTHLHYNLVEPGLEPYTFWGTDKENERDLAERREVLRQERLDEAKEALLALGGAGFGFKLRRRSAGRRPGSRSGESAKRSPRLRFPSSKVMQKAKDIPTLRVRRGDGSQVFVQLSTGVRVVYDAEGNPDFSPYYYKRGPHSVEIEYTGNRTRDERAANREARYDETPEGYTWHHGTGKWMHLVMTSVHDAFQHVGGFARHNAR